MSTASTEPTPPKPRFLFLSHMGRFTRPWPDTGSVTRLLDKLAADIKPAATATVVRPAFNDRSPCRMAALVARNRLGWDEEVVPLPSWNGVGNPWDAEERVRARARQIIESGVDQAFVFMHTPELFQTSWGELALYRDILQSLRTPVTLVSPLSNLERLVAAGAEDPIVLGAK